jgi:hypothetical protein
MMSDHRSQETRWFIKKDLIPDSMRTWKPRDFHDFLDINDVFSTSVCSSKSRGIHVATRLLVIKPTWFPRDFHVKLWRDFK